MALFGNNQNDGGNRNSTGRLGLMAVVAAYIIYLGVGILRSYINGEGGMPGWMSIVFGTLFIVFGVGYIIYLLRQYKRISEAAKEEAESEVIDAQATEVEPGRTAEAALDGGISQNHMDQTEASDEIGMDAAEGSE